MQTAHSYFHSNLNAHRVHTLLVSVLPLLPPTSLAMPESFSKYSQCLSFCHCSSAAHMAPSYSKHAHPSPHQLMGGWMMLIATLHFWTRLIVKVLSPHALQASVRWHVLASRHRKQLFWPRMEQDPACESAAAPPTSAASTLPLLICCGREVAVPWAYDQHFPSMMLTPQHPPSSHGNSKQASSLHTPIFDEYLFTNSSSLLPASILLAQMRCCGQGDDIMNG